MEEKDIHAELNAIRNLMERSTRFISLSGLSGVLAGIYALLGTYIAYDLLYPSAGGSSFKEYTITPLLLLAIAILLLSIATGIGMTFRQAKKKGEKFWNPISRKLFINMALPLITGGLFILILISKEQFDLIAASTLLFYGLALMAASQFTFSDVKWLGLCEIILGLLATLWPHYGLLLWAVGFGMLHILYGFMMHFKYKQ
jgi:hypothetical protein